MQNKPHDKTEIEMPPVGMLPPGPIDNQRLMEPNQCRIKQGLVIERDYKMVHDAVWMKFSSLYGGGPAIARCKPDIYSDALEEATFEFGPNDSEIKNIFSKRKRQDRLKQKSTTDTHGILRSKLPSLPIRREPKSQSRDR